MPTGQKAWNNNQQEIICKICQKHFFVSPTRRDKAKFCSYLCKSKSQKGLIVKGKQLDGLKLGWGWNKDLKGIQPWMNISGLNTGEPWNKNKIRTSIENGITFCKECHLIFHKKYGTKNNTKEQVNKFLKNSNCKTSIIML